MNTNVAHTQQMPLFFPTAESLASLKSLMASPGAVRRARRETGVTQTRKADVGKWRSPNLDNLTQEEINSAPSSFQELCGLVTVPEAVSLCLEFGGTKVVIPTAEVGTRWRKNETRDQLKELLSAASYTRLLAELGGSQMIFPRLKSIRKQRRDRQIRETVDALVRQKLPYNKAIRAICLAENIDVSAVYKVLKEGD